MRLQTCQDHTHESAVVHEALLGAARQLLGCQMMSEGLGLISMKTSDKTDNENTPAL